MRECRDSAVQDVPAGDLPELVAVLRALPWTGVVPTRSNVLRGDELAALPVRRGGVPSKAVYLGARVQDGVRAPVRRVLFDRSGPQGRRDREAEDG